MTLGKSRILLQIRLIGEFIMDIKKRQKSEFKGEASLSNNFGQGTVKETTSENRKQKQGDSLRTNNSVGTFGINVAIYARVSSLTQENENTIDSQIAELTNKAKNMGYNYSSKDIFTDEGYSGATLNRPGLERLRESIYDGLYKKVLIFDPDRLARDYVYQTLLIDEIRNEDCEIEFIRSPIGETPEQKMLLQVQGMISEYERTKILERTKRGRMHRMKQGEIVNGGDIFGYKYIRKKADIPTHYIIIEEEAEIIKQIFSWFIEEKWALNKICKKLDELGVENIRSAKHWHPAVIRSIIKNSIYTGTGYANKEKAVTPKRRQIDKVEFRKYEKTGREHRPKNEWYPYNSPRIISDEVFELAQQQLELNKRRAGRRTKKEYLLRSFLKCGECGHNMIAQRDHYQCQYSRPGYAKQNMKPVCINKKRIPMKELDLIVWEEIKKLLKNKTRLKDIYNQLGNKVVKKSVGNIESLTTKEIKLKKQIKRINDLYVVGTIEMADYKKLYEDKKEQLNKIETAIKNASEANQSDEELEEILNSFKLFSENIRDGIDNADFEIKRRAVEDTIKYVEIHLDEYIINFALPLRRKKGTLKTLSVIRALDSQ